MGADGSAYVTLGVQVTKDDFFHETERDRVCVKGHSPESPTQQFCSACGAPFIVRVIWTPTEAFQHFATEICRFDVAKDCWDALRDGMRIPGPYKGLSIGPVAGIESSEGSKDSPLGLGFRLLEQSGEGRGAHRANSLDIKKVMEYRETLVNVAGDLKLSASRPFELFLTYYWSC